LSEHLITRLQTSAALLDRFAEATGRIIAWLTLCMVLITFSVVILRYLFQSGSIALQESVSYLHACVFMLGAAYTLKHDGHVRVDIIYRTLSARGKAWINLAGSVLFLLPVCAFILYASREYVAASWTMREGSQEDGGLDEVFLLKTAMPVMAVLLLLQGLSLSLHSILFLTGRETASGDDQGLDQEL